jgi:hypothetical protein
MTDSDRLSIDLFLSSPSAKRGERIKVREAISFRAPPMPKAPPSLTLPRKGGGDDYSNASTA